MRRQIGLSLAALAIAARANMPCRAEEVKEPRFEVYTGADYDWPHRKRHLIARLSVFGPVTQPGFRLKLDGLADIYGDTDASLFSGKFMAADLKNVSNLRPATNSITVAPRSSSMRARPVRCRRGYTIPLARSCRRVPSAPRQRSKPIGR